MLQSKQHLAWGLLLAAVVPAAWAQSQDPLTFIAAYSRQTDSNLARVSVGAISEQIGLTTLGIGFKTRQSLQQFEVNASLVDYQYQNFKNRSFTDVNFDAAWRWSLTPRWRGNLTSLHKKAPDNSTDSSGYPRVDLTSALDTEYEIDGPWRLVGALSTTRQESQLISGTGNDFSASTGDLGARYVFASGSSMTYRMRTNQGTYLNNINPEYKQIDQDLRLRWSLGGGSALDANLTYITRSHPNNGQRDYDGFNTGANLYWQLSGKTTLVAGYQHVLYAYQTAYSNYSQTDSIALGPLWQISPKISLRWQNRFDQVQYLGAPAATTLSRRDTNRESTLSVNWQPYEKLGVATSIGTQSRGSNLAGADYDSNQFSVSAQLSY